ncbi:hypothetical protein FYK55_24035 [Roseiconus nitratireducens]|uniref:Uncharacterized protein n=1 Tax=Roseiconus nitratireducens TaxID=2605748 RepID=A0A5M6CW11_9BACT|nr:hypothetical protein [Roseiconus nitratireducens]KAA5539411.1 hypothetical protein FYK55_24035 [Roseiconus nitratireducens]
MCFTILIAGVLWCFSDSIEPLDRSQYDAAVALYGACNQRSPERIAMIESKLPPPDAKSPPSGPGHGALKEIIDLAKRGHWDHATEACRALLEDQVVRD